MNLRTTTYLSSDRLPLARGAEFSVRSVKQYGTATATLLPTLPSRQKISSSRPGRTLARATLRPVSEDASLTPEANRGTFLPINEMNGRPSASTHTAPAMAVSAGEEPWNPREAALADCRVLLFRGRGLISAAIRLQTRSVYSHAALLLPSGWILESWQGEGVRARYLSDWAGVEQFRVEGMTPARWAVAVDFAESQVGKGYDYLSVLRFVSRRNAPENGRWFCSELVAAALQVAGVPLLSRVDPAEISPAMLSWSPLLIRDEYD